MLDLLRDLFSYSFMLRAVIVGVLVSLCAALLGVSLVLKRYSMIGDGLSHVGFGALSVAVAAGAAPLAVSWLQRRFCCCGSASRAPSAEIRRSH